MSYHDHAAVSAAHHRSSYRRTCAMSVSSYASSIHDGLVRQLGTVGQLSRIFAPSYAQVVRRDRALA